MANVYVYSGAAGSGTGADWTNAYTTLGAAATAKAAGDVFFVAHDHAETAAAAKTITFPGTEANPNKVYCVNRAGSVPPVSADLRTTAQISVTGANTITMAGTATEVYGIIFNAGDSTAIGVINCQSQGRTIRYVNCSFRLLGTGSTGRIQPNTSTGGLTFWENCTVQYAAVGHRTDVSGRFIWRNTPSAILGSTMPTTLILQAGAFASVLLEGVDFSALTPTKTLFATTSQQNALSVIKDCKLASDVTVAVSNTTNLATARNTVVRSDGADTNYRFEVYDPLGTLTTETTIVRTGGASDGTTPIAWKIITTANSKWEMPFECPPITIWNDTTGSAKTITLQGIWGGGAVPTNDQIWIDVEYFGTSGFPLAAKATATKADGLATGSNLAAGTGTWGGSTTKFAMSVTITPQEKGPFTIYVRAATASTTFYIDPKPVIT